MKAFDTDVLTDLLDGRVDYWQRLTDIPTRHQVIPVVVVEEVLRGRLNSIRQAQDARKRAKLIEAYHFFERSFADLRTQQILAYDDAADEVFGKWRKQGVKTPTNDLRIAAICVACRATLVSRNRKDFERLPGLVVEFWE